MNKKFIFLCLSGFLSVGLFAQNTETNQQIQSKDTTLLSTSKEEKNRHEMLNAESNAGPRTVNFGLPFGGDLVILENDVPVVNYFYPTVPIFAWRSDNSLSKMGLLSFSEGALLTGKVGYIVKSSTREASSSFKGYGSIFVDGFGSSRYDLTLTGPLGKGWGYMVSGYAYYDKMNGINYQFTPWHDQTYLFKAAIQKNYKRGNVRLIYKYGDSKYILTNYSPLRYKGNGKTALLQNFDLGSDSYILGSGLAPYYDANTGEAKYANLASDEFLRSISHNVYLTGNHQFNGGWKLNYSSMWQSMNSPMCVTFPLSINAYDPDQYAANNWNFKYAGSSTPYTGSVQMVLNQVMPQSLVRSFFTRVELTKKFNNHDLRFGLNQTFDHRKYTVNGGMYFQTVEANPKLLDMYTYVPAYNMTVKATNDHSLMPASAAGYGSSSDISYNKYALYISDDMKIGRTIDLGLGIRMENQTMSENHDPYVNDFINNRPLTSESSNRWNKVGIANLVYKMTKSFGLVGEGSYNSWWDRYWDYPYRDANGNPIADPSTPGAKPLQTVPKDNQLSVLNVGGGIFYNWGTTLQLVSKITYITKNNIKTSESVMNPANASEKMTFDPILYDIQTLGWTTDMMINVKNFSLHYLLTLQNPKYKNFSYSAFGTTYNYSENYIPELSRTLMEIDPSYSFANGMRLWVSLRYFGKQYGNPTNAFYYNAWWENFGGLDYRISRNINLKLQVTNFLNQKGVKGAVQGADQITDATPYIDRLIVASGMRPRTIELTCNFKF